MSDNIARPTVGLVVVLDLTRAVQDAVEQKNLPPEALVRACREDVASFAAKRVFSDDFTLLALRRVSEGTQAVQ